LVERIPFARSDATLLGQTIDSLAFIGDSAAIVPLICLFHKLKDDEIRLKIAQALGTLSETDSIDDVYAALQGVAANR
jgi:HEAT repeat protein